MIIKQLAVILTIILLPLTICMGQEQNDKQDLKLSDLKFESIFGTIPSEPNVTYSLLGTGFFKTPRSSNSDSLINKWIENHPDAKVIPVSSFGPVLSNESDSKMVYSWVVSKKDTLNNYLIKNGCFPGTTMIRPKTLDEMEETERELYEDSEVKTEVKVYIDEKAYNNFIKQIQSAERHAKGKKLGIWKKETGQ